ncbi:MAG: single-stranded DNA-binding protein [Candidatus Cryptobacteroides sp.]
MSLNKVMLIGNVGADPEIRYLEGATAQDSVKVASLRIATTERYRDRDGNYQEHTEWHSVTAWRGNAEIIDKYVRKGTQLYVEGKIRSRSWTDKDNNVRNSIEILADNIQLLGKRPD